MMPARLSPQAKVPVARSTYLTKLDWLLLLLVLSIAIIFRFWQQGQIPPGMDFDEAFESLEAHRLLTEPGYHPIFFIGNNGVPALRIYLTAAAFLVAGEHTLASRYVSAIIGTLTILALYLFVRKLFSPALPAGDGGAVREPGMSPIVYRFLPFVACLILAVLPWHNAFSRRGIEVILLPLWAILALFSLWQGLKTLKWGRFAISGFFWGSAYYTYQAAWFLPGVLVLFLMYKAFQERGFLRRYAGRLLLLALVAILVVLPLAQFAYQNSAVFAHRSRQVSLLGLGRGSETPLLNLAGNIWKVARFFVSGGDINLSDNISNRPPAPLALTLALLIGILVALRRIRRAEYGLLVVWFVGMLLPTILTEDAPSIRRAIGAVPAMVTLIALGLGWLFDLVKRWMQGRHIWQTLAPLAVGLTISGLLVYTAIWSYQYYFVEWGRGKELFHYFDVGLVEIGEYAASTPADTRLYYTPAGEGDVIHLPLTWQVRDRNLRTFDGRFGLVLTPADPRLGLYLITTFLGDSWALPALRQFYPTGRVVQEVRNRYGVLHSLAFAVDPDTAPVVQPQNRMALNFQNQVELLGSDLSSTEIRAGDALTVTLFWRSTVGPTPVSYTVFTHLLGSPKPADGSPIWAGRDSPPLNNSYPTTRWTQGEIVVDRYTLTVPTDAPAGTYPIEAGLYSPKEGGARLKVLDPADKTQADSVLVGAVRVK